MRPPAKAELPDDDPDVIAGMERLRILREQEGSIPDATPVISTTRAERTVRRELEHQQRVNDLRARRLRNGGPDAVWEREITVRGESIFYWAPVIEQLKRTGDLNGALNLAWECMEVAEGALASRLGLRPPGWAIKVAVICRKLKRYDLEVEVLERYLAQVPDGEELDWVTQVRHRLEAARRLSRPWG